MLDQIDIMEIVAIAERAGDAIMKIYDSDFTITYKDDNSPLSEADTKAHDIIVNGLKSLKIIFPILSEEGGEIAYEERKKWKYFWMVDPLDGTKEFIKKNDEFTVNIALIYIDTPVLGVVYAPALKEMYWAKIGEGAYKNAQKLPIHFNGKADKFLRVVASKSHLNSETKEYIEELSKNIENIECISRGSSLKLCMIAEGSADIYPRLAPTMEWDTAAGDAVVRAAGGTTAKWNSKELLKYNKNTLLNPWFIVQRA